MVQADSYRTLHRDGLTDDGGLVDGEDLEDTIDAAEQANVDEERASGLPDDPENRHYAAGYAYACGYHD